jgi:hypothetical protein
MTKSATTQLPHAFKRIRLEIARSKEFPSGSSRHGYEFVAPLDGNGHIDPSLWRQHRDNCRVRRFWGGEEEIGHLLHKPAVRSMRNGFSITTMRPNMTTSRAIGSAHMPLRPANMSRSATMRASCTPSVCCP